MRGFSLWLIGMLLLPSSMPLLAQQVNGSMTGTVTDASGATVPGATVRVKSKDTNATRESATDGSGNYTIPFLPPGDYAVTVTAKGSQTQNIANLNLQVQQTLRQDFQLAVGDMAQSVNVDATAATLQTDSAVVGTVIDSAKVVQLPLNGRPWGQYKASPS